MYHLKNGEQRKLFEQKIRKAALAGKIRSKYIVNKNIKDEALLAWQFVKVKTIEAYHEILTIPLKRAAAFSIVLLISILALNLCVLSARISDLEKENDAIIHEKDSITQASNEEEEKLKQNIADLEDKLKTDKQESKQKDQIIKNQQNTIDQNASEKEEIIKDFVKQIENIQLTNSDASRSDSEINSIKNGIAETELLIRDTLGYSETADKLVESLHAKADAFQDLLDRYPNHYPTVGDISSPFGWRIHPVDGVLRFHQGVDIGYIYGSAIWAAAKGVVVYAEESSGYGYNMVVDHGNGLQTRYAHLSQMLYKVGDEVTKGETIARMGATGMVTGPHLHFEVILNGEVVDPEPYICG